MKKHYLLFFLLAVPLFVFSEIRGVVVDDAGMPLAGVVVQTSNGSVSTTTDFDGFFVIDVPYGAELEIAFLGYKKQVVRASNNMRIEMQSKRRKPKTGGSAASQSWKMFVFANGLTAFPFQPAAGLTLGMVKKGGWYVSALTGFNFNFEADAVLYQGKEPLYFGGSFIGYDTPFYTGEKTQQMLSITAGGVAQLGNSEMYFYGGAGYGFKSITLKTNNNNWIAYSTEAYNNYSPMHSAALEAGFLGNIKGFALSVGYEVMLGVQPHISAAHELKIGIGGMFNLKGRAEK